MTYSFRPSGVCSQEMRVELDDQGIIRDLKVVGRMQRQPAGISALVRDMPAQEAIARLRGIRCGFKPTSCPDQLAQGLEKILQQQ